MGRAQLAQHGQLLGAVHRGHLGAVIPSDLHARGADAAARAFDQHPFARLDLCLAQEVQRLQPAGGHGRGLVAGDIGRHSRQHAVARLFGQTTILGVSAEPETGGAEDAVPRLEPVDTRAHRLDLAGKLLAQHDGLARLAQAEVEAHGNRQEHRKLHAARLAVAGGHRRRAHLDEHLVILGDRLVHLLQL